MLPHPKTVPVDVDRPKVIGFFPSMRLAFRTGNDEASDRIVPLERLGRIEQLCSELTRVY